MSKRYYESYIIIDGNLEDAAIDEEIQKYEAFFTKNEIEVNNLDKMGRKRLAYPIQKKQNGFYICFEIMAPPQTITKLERTYKLDENILRYLTVYMSPKTIREKEDHLKNKAIIQSKYEETKNLAATAENNVPVTKDTETKDTVTKDTETKDTETKDTETKDTETKGTETKGTETKGTETKDTETKDTETKDKETKDKETKGTETKDKETASVVS